MYVPCQQRIFNTTRGSALLILLRHDVRLDENRALVLLAAIVVLVFGSTRRSRKPAAELLEARVSVTA